MKAMPTPEPTRPIRHSADVIVIGAGMAGLGAARTIVDSGHSTIVLEARERLGGRLWTDHDHMGVPVELGAELIHGSLASTWDIVAKQGIDTHRLDGHRARRTPGEPWRSQQDTAFYTFPRRRPALPSPLPEPGDGELALDYLLRLGIEQDNLPLALALVETDAESLHALPAAAIEEALHLVAHVDRGGALPDMAGYADYRVPGGYDQLVSAIAFPLDIRTREIVRAVRVSSEWVEIDTFTQVSSARIVVVAVPAGVLQAGMIEFTPSLPYDQHASIAGVEHLPVFKMALEFSHPVIPTSWDVVEDCSLAVPTFWNASSGVPGHQGQIVIAWATGDNARRLLALGDAAQQVEVLASLSEVTGKPIPPPVATASHDWAADPFARGAYPGPKPLPEGLYAPLGNRIFWAGMVTETVDESYDSGREAGLQALHALE